jgi:hypothetical protein
MASRSYTFTRGLDHTSIMAASARVDWTVDGIFRDRGFDTSKSIVPAAWVGTHALAFLDAQEQLTLNHCRAFSYVHLLGNFEEFIPLHLDGMVQHRGHTDHAESRALTRFGAEEVKHQELFRRAETVLEQSCGHPFGRYFDREKTRVTELTAAILAHPLLPRFLTLLALEWGTQRHYVESIRDRTDQRSDPLYVDILRAHWVEEAQHTKWDTLAIAQLAGESSAEELSTAFDHIPAIGGLIDATFAGQVDKEIETFHQLTGRRHSHAQLTALRETLHRSMSAIIVGVALSHPSFTKIARELSNDGAAKLGIA